jgi:protein TonB
MNGRLDIVFGAAASAVVHALLFLAPSDWAFLEPPQLIVAKGRTSIEIGFARRPARLAETPHVEKVEEAPRAQTRPPDIPPPPPPRPEDISIPRPRDVEPPPLAQPGPERPEAVEPTPPPDVGSDVPRGVTAARVIGDARPRYPEDARQRGIEGTVELLVEVLPQGRAGAVVMKKSSGSWRLDRAAEDFYRTEARFIPARRLGRPVSYTLHYAVRFELTDEERESVRSSAGENPEPEQ